MADIAIAVAAKVAEYLVAPIASPFVYLWNYKTNVENLKNGVEKLQARRETVQCSISAGEEPLPHVKLWQDRVDRIIDEASEVLVVDNPEQANVHCCKGVSCPNLLKRYRCSKKAAGKLKEDVVGLEEEAARLGEVSRPTVPEQVCLRLSEDHQHFETRNSLLKNVIGALCDPDVNMVGIYGFGGIGKTTLAKEIAREATKDKLFDKIVFVEVSLSPEIKTIQGVIGENLGLNFSGQESVSGRADRLYDLLKTKEKFLLILDNIWERIDLKTIGIPFENKSKGLKLLSTTRSLDVLTQMNSQHNFQMMALDDADAWSLFKSITGACLDQPYLKSTALDIVKECRGMPLAIVSIANALRNKDESAWKNALGELRNPSPHNFEGMTKDVYKSIMLSYNTLENEELKMIFLLCCLMGRTYDASVRDLFRYGFGLGLFRRFDTIEAALCNVYASINKLKATSLLLDAPQSNVIFKDPSLERFAMHDIVCDVAKLILLRDRKMFPTGANDIIPRSWTKRNTLCDYTSIALYNIGELPEDLELLCPNLEFLYMKPKEPWSRIPNNMFVRMPRLRVLHLIEVELWPLPTSLSCLENLKTLCLDVCKLEDITAIGKLKNLEILSFRGSNIKNLSEQMRHLINLRLLDLTDCAQLRIIPPGVISSFTELEALYMGGTSIQWEVEIPNIERKNASLDELKKLTQLTTLEIHIPDAKMSKGLLFSKLERYRILIGHYWDPLFWAVPPKTCRLLTLNPATDDVHEVISQLKGIRELEFHDGPPVRDFVGLDRNSFAELKHLDVGYNSDCPCVVDLNHSASPYVLPSLESLTLWDMKGLKNICKGLLGAQSFCQLRTVHVFDCPDLNKIFSFSAYRALPRLEEIKVERCKNLKEIFVIEEKDNEASRETKFNHLRSLRLAGLPQVKSFCCQVQLTNYAKAKEISPKEELDIHRPLFNDKVLFPNLETLEVGDVHVENIWLPRMPIWQNLTALTVYCCDNLEELFPSPMVATEELREGGRRDTISFPHLNSLRLESLRKLRRLCSGCYIQFPLLKFFSMWDCHELKEFIFDCKVEAPSLENLEINNMNELKMIWHYQLAKDSFMQLKSLNVVSCQKLLTVFPLIMLGSFSSLESLYIRGCDSLEEIFYLQGINSEGRHSTAATQLCDYDPQILLSFANLQELEVSYCRSLKNLFRASTVATEVAEAQVAPAKFYFPKLTSLKLIELPNFRTFYPGRHTVEGPFLKRLELHHCSIHDTDEKDRMRQPLFLLEKAFPCLKELRLPGKSFMMMWEDQVLEFFFHKLKILEIHDDQAVELPHGSIQRFHNLEMLSLENSLYNEIFSWEEAQAQRQTLERMKKLVLKDLKDLKYIWKQDSRLDLLLQNLEVLEVGRCCRLINMLPVSTSVLNLTVLEVKQCHGLTNMITSSNAKSMVQLVQMTVYGCSKVTEVIGDKGDVTGDRIIFNKLKSLSLQRLPNLTRFCSLNFSLELPSLEKLDVDGCPKMKIFSRGALTVQKLQHFKINRESMEPCPDIDLNTALQEFREKTKAESFEENCGAF